MEYFQRIFFINKILQSRLIATGSYVLNLLREKLIFYLRKIVEKANQVIVHE